MPLLLSSKATIEQMLRAAAQIGRDPTRRGPVRLEFCMGENILEVEVRVISLDGKPIIQVDGYVPPPTNKGES